MINPLTVISFRLFINLLI